MIKDAILGSYWTLAVGTAPFGAEVCVHDFRRRVECASRAGYTGMGFWHADLEALAQSYSFFELGRILQDKGIVHIEVEWLNDWFSSGDRRVASDQSRNLLLNAAEGLRARHIKVADLGNDGVPMALLIEEFARLCTEAAERGTAILFEMLPAQFSGLPSLDSVLELTRGAGAANGGIMLDNLHIERTGTSFADIRNKLTPGDLVGVEINDGSLASPVDFLDSVLNKRLLPGDGEFDIAGFLQAVWSAGYDGPIGVEVMHEYLRQWPLDVMADISFNKTASVVEAARAG